MKVENKVMPDAGQIDAMINDPGPDGPIVMVNMLKFRDKARYEDGSDADLSGMEAYARYGTAVAPLIEKHGGKLVFSGSVTFLMLGEVESVWDQISLAQYPNRSALFAMASSPEYQAISHHRDAGLEGQLNIETTPQFMTGG